MPVVGMGDGGGGSNNGNQTKQEAASEIHLTARFNAANIFCSIFSLNLDPHQCFLLRSVPAYCHYSNLRNWPKADFILFGNISNHLENAKIKNDKI